METEKLVTAIGGALIVVLIVMIVSLRACEDPVIYSLLAAGIVAVYGAACGFGRWWGLEW